MDSSSSSSQLPSSSSKYHRPYFTAAEIEVLSEKQRGKLSVSQEDKLRQSACSFIEAMGARIGFPRRTLAAAQSLYHRFHLFFPRKDFNYFDVSLAALYVSTKMHDTLKKPRELLAVSYAIRFPELAAKSKTGEVDIDRMDQAAVEHDRSRLIAVERLILETICFNFTSRMAFPYVIKIGRALDATKQMTKAAWRLAADAHRTYISIQYPPHLLALGSLYVAALLASFDPTTTSDIILDSPSTHRLAVLLGNPGDWEAKFQANHADLEEIAHGIIDILIQGSQNPAMSANPSPRTPSSPSHSSSSSRIVQLQAPQLVSYKSDQLMQLKIALRERQENIGRKRKSEIEEDVADSNASRKRAKLSITELGLKNTNTMVDDPSYNLLGRNEGTVRFLFGPPGIVGHGI